jgi:AbrB family looped-hinge helix DNA binding protein
MEVARITTKGQITIPIEIRKKLALKEGDKILFFEEENGRIYFENASLLAFNRIQDSMAGEAQKAGFKTEQELQDYMREIRKETWEKNYARND